MGTVVGQVIDYLVAQLAAPAKAAVPDAMVIDANTNDDLSSSMIWIGRNAPQDLQAGNAARGFPVLGRRSIDEDWTIPGFIDCHREGTDQKAARDPALALWDVVCHLASTDPTLGNIITSGYYVELPNAELFQPDPPQTAAARALVLFSVRFRSRYIP